MTMNKYISKFVLMSAFAVAGAVGTSSLRKVTTS